MAKRKAETVKKEEGRVQKVLRKTGEGVDLVQNHIIPTTKKLYSLYEMIHGRPIK